MIDWIVNVVQKFQPEIKVENLATDDARRLDLQVPTHSEQKIF